MESTKHQVVVSIVGVFVSATKIVIGTGYLTDCPVQKFLPVFLIVSGCLPALLCAWRGLLSWNKLEGHKRLVNRIWIVFGVAGILLNISFLAGGSVLVATTWTRMEKDICIVRPFERFEENLTSTSINEIETTVNFVTYSGSASGVVTNVTGAAPSTCGTASVRPCALPLLVFTTLVVVFDWLFAALSCFYCVTGRWRKFCEYDGIPDHDALTTSRDKRPKSVKWQDMEDFA